MSYFDHVYPRRWENWECVQNVNWKNGTREYLHQVRDFRVTARAKSDRYYDYENDVYILDKMEAIHPLTWDDLLDTDVSQYGNNDRHRQSIYWKTDNKWFTPKDNDFDEECRRDEELKKIAAENAEKEKLYKEVLKLEQKAKEMKERHQEEIEHIYHKYSNCHPGTNVIKNKWTVR